LQKTVHYWRTVNCNEENNNPKKAKLPCIVRREGPRNMTAVVEVEEFP